MKLIDAVVPENRFCSIASSVLDDSLKFYSKKDLFIG